MRISIVSMLFLGLVTAAPAPAVAPPSYDRSLPARRGEPPAKRIRRAVDIDVIKPTATGTVIGTGTAPLKTTWPTSVNAAPKPKPTATGTKVVVALKPTGTSPVVVGTGTAGIIKSAAPTLPIVKSSYNFPSLTTTKVGKRETEATPAFWWVQN